MAVRPVKYECNLKNLTSPFARSKISQTRKSMNGASEPPNPDPVDIKINPLSLITSNETIPRRVVPINDSLKYFASDDYCNEIPKNWTTMTLNRFPNFKTAREKRAMILSFPPLPGNGLNNRYNYKKRDRNQILTLFEAMFYFHSNIRSAVRFREIASVIVNDITRSTQR